MITRDVVLIGVPTNSSGTADGVARAPGVLRERGLAAALAGRPGFTDVGDQLGQLTAAALAMQGCAGWSVCIYNPDLDPDLSGADAIISYLARAITVADRRLGRDATT
jgi:hypothetical protein